MCKNRATQQLKELHHKTKTSWVIFYLTVIVAIIILGLLITSLWADLHGKKDLAMYSNWSMSLMFLIEVILLIFEDTRNHLQSRNILK